MNEEAIKAKAEQVLKQSGLNPDSTRFPYIVADVAAAMLSMLPPPGSVLTADGSVLEAAFDQRVAQTHGRSNDGQWYNVPIFFPYPAAQAARTEVGRG